MTSVYHIFPFIAAFIFNQRGYRLCDDDCSRPLGFGGLQPSTYGHIWTSVPRLQWTYALHFRIKFGFVCFIVI